uniref:Hydrophobic seed protein domain-containing protein n=1 Tax=Kalanchoe fedtschenkoi TaxID=63787 RepID=A0A7N0UXR4_KALFE
MSRIPLQQLQQPPDHEHGPGGRNLIFDADPGPDPDPSPPPPTSPPSTPSIFDADPSPPTSPSPPSAPPPVTLAPKNCKTDPLQLIVCSPLINHGPLWPLNVPCCGLMGLFGLEVRACLCIAMKTNIMGWCHVDLPINLNVLMSFCQFTIEPAFQC